MQRTTIGAAVKVREDLALKVAGSAATNVSTSKGALLGDS